MTDRLYYEDSHLATFPAVVTACEQEKDYWKVTLDQTAFFPEGGGQAGDTGHLGEIEVFDTHEKNGEIWHYTRQPLEVGAEVKGVLDWEKRFSRMQQHSGEHIVSGLIHTRFGYYRQIGSSVSHRLLYHEIIKISHTAIHIFLIEIGRASCRERV